MPTPAADERVQPRDVARHIRSVLAAMDDPADELVASAAMRARMEGAAIALEAIASAQDVVFGAASSTE